MDSGLLVPIHRHETFGDNMGSFASYLHLSMCGTDRDFWRQCYGALEGALRDSARVHLEVYLELVLWCTVKDAS